MLIQLFQKINDTHNHKQRTNITYYTKRNRDMVKNIDIKRTPHKRADDINGSGRI